MPSGIVRNLAPRTCRYCDKQFTPYTIQQMTCPDCGKSRTAPRHCIVCGERLTASNASRYCMAPDCQAEKRENQRAYDREQKRKKRCGEGKTFEKQMVRQYETSSTFAVVQVGDFRNLQLTRKELEDMLTYGCFDTAEQTIRVIIRQVLQVTIDGQEEHRQRMVFNGNTISITGASIMAAQIKQGKQHA